MSSSGYDYGAHGRNHAVLRSVSGVLLLFIF